MHLFKAVFQRNMGNGSTKGVWSAHSSAVCTHRARWEGARIISNDPGLPALQIKLPFCF